MKEDKLIEFNKFKPTSGSLSDYMITKNNKKLYKLYDWIIDSAIEISKKRNLIIYRNKYLTGISLSDKLRQINWTPQIYYDSIVLGLADENGRPKCKICGKVLEFDCISHGYPKTCSKDCHKKLKSKQIEDNSKMTKKGETIPEERKQKIKNTLISIPKEVRFNDTWREKHSNYMKSFAKTKEGREYYKRVGDIVSKKNIERLLSSEDYFKNKNFKRGIYDSVILNKHLRYDSEWELIFIKYIETVVESGTIISVFDRCKDYIRYNWDDDTVHRYLPDFFIKLNDGTKIVLEIKPHYLVKSNRKTELSIAAAKKYFNNKGIKYAVLTEKDFLNGKKLNPLFDIILFINKN